ncbi:hypothetical protein [Methanococcus maripaludis]|uniref:Uncharacterized protein n=2 Tax=Methanococcus maripaludis TaxID=39152 RepID=A0A7J9PIC5_METMI|nr:hypothetical protein [Methanococcus maripaludis]MBA2862983.1 hypothetical protein [Methanococcus maripaludis]
MVDFSKYFESYELIKKYWVFVKEGDEFPAKIKLAKNLKTGQYCAYLKLSNGKHYSSKCYATVGEAMNDPEIVNNIK